MAKRGQTIRPRDESEVRDALMAATTSHYGAVVEFAARHGLTNSHVSQIRTGKRPMPLYVGEALGFELVWRRKETGETR